MPQPADPVAILNRGVLALGSLVVLGLAAAGALDAQAMVANGKAYLDAIGRADPATTQATVAAIGLVATFVFLVEVWPRWRRPVFETRIDGGIIEYSAQVVADALDRDLTGVDGVGEHRVEVNGRGNKVQVRIQIALDRDSDPTAIASRMSSQARECIKRLGLETDLVRLTIDPAPKTARQPAQQVQTAA
jgi:hypothetical protein